MTSKLLTLPDGSVSSLDAKPKVSQVEGWITQDATPRNSCGFNFGHWVCETSYFTVCPLFLLT